MCIKNANQELVNILNRKQPTAIRKGKTDKLDSIRIAKYGIDNWFNLKDFQSAEAVYDELKATSKNL